MRLKGKVAIVTGGGSGFGEGIVRHFVKEGAQVIVADRDGAAGERVANSLGGECASAQADVSTLEGFRIATDMASDRFGGLDILVNNAGVPQVPTPLEDVEEEIFDRLFTVNMKSVYHGARLAVPLMRARGGGAILNIASTGGVRPRPFLTWYNASKGWMTTATRAMAIELASAGIRVNAINPVAGATPMLSSFMREDSDEARQLMINTIPLGRLSTPADMGAAAVFLCSEEASMITGVALEVDGGRCI